jgi:hypothetical protein
MLILEIAIGIVLAVLILNAASFLISWVADWSTGTKLIVVLTFVFLVVAAYSDLVADKKAGSVSTQQEPYPGTLLESRASFAARYKKANPETANIPDEELVKKVLQEYPEWCPKVQGGCP